MFPGAEKEERSKTMHKKSLHPEVQQDDVSPGSELSVAAVRIRQHQCCALVRIEPEPEWLILYRKIEFEK